MNGFTGYAEIRIGKDTILFDQISVRTSRTSDCWERHGGEVPIDQKDGFHTSFVPLMDPPHGCSRDCIRSTRVDRSMAMGGDFCCDIPDGVDRSVLISAYGSSQQRI